MSETRYLTTAITPEDTAAGFSSGVHPLDDYFRRHALSNSTQGVGRVYVLRPNPSEAADLPSVIGFYTLSMAQLESSLAGPIIQQSMPRYPMPVALIGRLAVDRRARGLGMGEQLLLDALQRIVDASSLLGCIGIIVDAKNEDAERFYAKYDFVSLPPPSWPRRMFLPIGTARDALESE